MRVYIDEMTPGELLGILVRLPWYLIKVVQEELFWWFKLYPFEISYPIDWQKLRKQCLKESARRTRYNKKREGVGLPWLD